MQLPKDNGLSSNEEFAILGAVEDKLTGELERRRDATFVGRTTVAGVRDFYYYVSQSIDRIAIKETTARFPEYRFECSCTHDPSWSHYLEVLYPSDEEFETIKNQHVLEALRKNGDDLSQERPVTHWSFFKTQQDRQAFLSEALEMGFSIHDLHEDWDEEYPLVACLERADYVDHDSINSVVIDLLRLTENHHGTYDGWETQVVEAGTEPSDE
jgi:uncharacterized protein (TIGR01619 family)